ncbi:MAG: hypothetical protein RXR02_02890 [Thermoproteus sp.]
MKVGSPLVFTPASARMQFQTAEPIRLALIVASRRVREELAKDVS